MEVEVKARIDDPDKVERKLISMGAQFVGMEKEEDIYFAHPSRNFALTDEALRIRNGRVLTYKGPRVDKETKSRQEIEVEIGDGEKMSAILQKLGFIPVAVVRKLRKNYRIGDVSVFLDHLEELGDFVEIECLGEYEESKRKVLKIASQLGLSEFITLSYLELLLEGKKG